MSLSDYLVKKYLNADPSPSTTKPSTKKRKRKEVQPAGLTIADDDAFTSQPTRTANDSDDDAPTTISGTTAEFRRAKKSAWTTVGAPAPSHSEQAAADAIIASAAAENAAQAGDDDDAPQVVSSATDPSVAKMESGAHAGLQTAAQVSAAMALRRAEERARFDAVSKSEGTAAQTHETIYRDASGRVINVAMKRAEARRKAEEDAAKAAKEQEALKGDVQRAAKEERGRALEDAKFMGVARFADDVGLNEELRGQERWNDPAAQFLTKKKAKKSVSGKPLYKGAAPPNRYGVRPGYRWDGVDRGNGFEKEWFAARNKKESLKDLQYAWQMDE